jgi:hypothetical protein
MYKRILDPTTGRHVRVNSRQGERILNNYVNMLGGVKSKKKLIDIDCKSITDESECREKDDFCTWNSNNKCQKARDKDSTDVRKARENAVDGRTREGKVRKAALAGIKSHRRLRHRSSPHGSSMRPQFLSPSLSDTSSTDSSSSRPSLSDDLSSEIQDYHRKHKKVIGPSHKPFAMPETRTGHVSTHDLEHGHNQFVGRRARRNLGKLRNMGRTLGRWKHQSDLSKQIIGPSHKPFGMPETRTGHLSRRDLMRGRDRLRGREDRSFSDLERGQHHNLSHQANEWYPRQPAPAYSDTSSLFSHGPIDEALHYSRHREEVPYHTEQRFPPRVYPSY